MINGLYTGGSVSVSVQAETTSELSVPVSAGMATAALEVSRYICFTFG